MHAPRSEALDSTTDRWVLWALGAALVLRCGLVWLFPDPRLQNDEIDYWRLAEGLARGEGFVSNFRPPLYPAFMALFIGLGEGTVAVRAAQAVLGALSVPLVALLGARLGGIATARVAAWCLALDPVLIGFSHLLWSETLYIVLLLAGLALLLGERRPARWAAAGVCFGLAGLTRPQLLTFLPLLLPWTWLWTRREGAAHWRRSALAFAALTLATCAVVLPWSWRNAQVWGAFFLVDTNGPYNVLVGTEPGAYQVDKDDRWSPAWASMGDVHYTFAVERAPGPVQQLALRRARRRIAAHPGRFVEKSLWEAGHLFTLDNFVLRHLRNGWYGAPTPRVLAVLLTLWSAGWTALLYGGGVVGLAAQPLSPLRSFTLLALGHAVVLFGLSYSLSRYAVPLRPLLVLGLAWLSTHRGAALARLRVDRRCAAFCALALLWLALAWLRDVPLLADMLATGGRDFRFLKAMHL